MTGVVDDVVGVQVGVRARRLTLVVLGHRQPLLQLRQKHREAAQSPAPFEVLHEDIGLVGGTITEQPVLVGFDRPDDDVDLVRLDVHPEEVAGLEVVADQRRGAQLEIGRKPRVFGEVRGLAQQFGSLLQLRLVGHVVRHQHQRPGLVAAHQRIEALLTGQVRGLEFLFAHVGRIEVRAERFVAESGDKGRIVGQPVPGTVIQ